MKKQEFIQSIKEKLPNNLSELEIAKYIYIQLGKQKAFDEKYFFGNSKTRKKIYKLAEQNKIDSEQASKNKKIICVSLSYLYRDILKEFGINSVIAEEMEHKYPIIVLKNGKRIRADLQLDLYNIHTKSKTKYFGTKEKYGEELVEELSDEKNIEIDKRIGYIKDENEYKDSSICRLKEEIQGKDANEFLRIILQDSEINKFDKKLEYVELYKYYKSVLNKIDNKFLDKKIFALTCFRERKNGYKDYTMCLYSVEKSNVNTYLFSKKEKRFLKVELSKIETLEKQGLHFGIGPKDRGLKKLKKLIEEQKNNEKMFE